jgi:hypothetical protein
MTPEEHQVNTFVDQWVSDIMRSSDSGMLLALEQVDGTIKVWSTIEPDRVADVLDKVLEFSKAGQN